MNNKLALPKCIKCGCEHAYEDGNNYVCPECFHEWPLVDSEKDEENINSEDVVKDANGVILHDGDSVVVLKDLKVKGSSAVVKVGTKVKNIRIVGGDHDIDCKIPGIGSIKLKSEFVKKA